MGKKAASLRLSIDVGICPEPVSIVSIISPWSFQIATASWKIFSALSCCDALVWKQANLAPVSAVPLTEFIARQDIRRGLFGLKMGTGGVLGQRIVESRKVNAFLLQAQRPLAKLMCIQLRKT